MGCRKRRARSSSSSATSSSWLVYNGHKWGDKGLAELCEVLPLCASLKGLGLHCNAIGDAGAAALANVIGALRAGHCRDWKRLYSAGKPDWRGGAGRAGRGDPRRGLGCLKKLKISSGLLLAKTMV